VCVCATSHHFFFLRDNTKMRVLIVDGFLSTPQGRQNLQEFKGVIQKAFEAPFYKSLCGDLAFAVRDKTKLQDFLYDSATEFSDHAAMRSFMSLDIVFIGSDDNNILPWARSVRQVSILLKNCIRMHKPTFATSFAMQMLASMCLLEGEEIKVCNGRGRGGPLTPNYSTEPASLPRVLDQLSQVYVDLQSDEYFLDAGTGDLYGQATKEKEWYFTGKNVGICNPVFAFAPKATDAHVAYKSKLQRWENVKPQKVRVDEQYCELTNARYLQHWLLKKLPKQFILPSRCSWDVTWDMPPYFDILLGGKSPILIVFGPVCGFQSLISRRYPESIHILNNWINFVVDRILNNESHSLGYCIEVLGPSRTVPVSFVKFQGDKSKEEREVKGAKENRFEEPSPQLDTLLPREQAPSRKVGEAIERRTIGHAPGNKKLTWTDITRAFAKEPDSTDRCRRFSRGEIRRFLHPNILSENVDPEEVKKVVYVGSRPGSRKQKPRNSNKPLEPFRFPGKMTTGEGFPGQIKNFVAMTPGPGPLDHCFRETNKTKWFDSRGFVPAAGGWAELPIAQDSASNHTLSRIPFRFRDQVVNARRNSERRPRTVPASHKIR